MIEVLGYSDFDYLCCDINEFIEHIENQFDDKMSWDNYTEYWEMDHIKPLGNRDISVDEKIERFCYLNVRPLSITENKRKWCKEVDI